MLAEIMGVPDHIIAAGPAIIGRGEIPAFANVDVAATIAALLELGPNKMQGKPLSAILTLCANRVSCG